MTRAYAKASGIPYEIGFTKNKYVARTFIAPTQGDRETGVSIKLHPIRAVVEGQIANMRERTRWIGDFATIYVTGGASRSKGILATIREIFGAEVRTLDVPDSAAVGGAILAARAVR